MSPIVKSSDRCAKRHVTTTALPADLIVGYGLCCCSMVAHELEPEPQWIFWDVKGTFTQFSDRTPNCWVMLLAQAPRDGDKLITVQRSRKLFRSEIVTAAKKPADDNSTGKETCHACSFSRSQRQGSFPDAGHLRRNSADHGQPSTD